MTRAVPAFAGLAMLALTLGCMPGSITDPDLLNPTTNCSAAQVFSKYMCAQSGCHDAGGTSAKFDMATTGWEMNLVGVNPMGGGAPASQCMTMGPYLMGPAPATGLFLRKIMSSNPGCGARMPFGGGQLNTSEIKCVQDWANMLVTQ